MLKHHNALSVECWEKNIVLDKGPDKVDRESSNVLEFWQALSSAKEMC